MQIDINDTNKLVSIWLTNSEGSDENLNKNLKPLYKEYKAKKYKVAVIYSGDKDICELTEGLIVSNKYKLYGNKNNTA